MWIEPLEDTVAEITADGGKADWRALNIRDEAEVDAVIAEIARTYGRIDLN